MNATALIAGGGARIGLEDNLYFVVARICLASNRELIERLLTIAGALGKRPYGIAETRSLLGLEPRAARGGQSSAGVTAAPGAGDER
jgi:uncharacterized protein (DUF849 family)